MLRKLFLICVALSFALAFAACSEDDDDDGDPTGNGGGKPPAEMLGNWTYQAVTIDGNPASLATVLDWVPSAVRAEIFFRDDGAYLYQEVLANGGQLWWEAGFVFIDGTELDINLLNDQDGTASGTTRMAWSIDMGTLTLTKTSGATVTVFTLTM